MTFNHYRTLLATTALVVAFSPELSQALPTGGSVSSGTATISQAAKQTTVNQTSQDAVINWTGFNTASGETVKFNDPNSSSITLNRVSGPATSFSGALSSNGNVWVMNSQGVVFNNTAKVNVNGLLATTSSIDDADFMAGNYNFTPGSNAPGAKVTNAGSITVANSGLAALVAPNVANSGTINATLGRINLASGDTYTVDLNGDGLINLQASKAVTSQMLSNNGTLNANGGNVVMTAAQASNVVDSLVNLDGAVTANNVSVTNNGGDVEYGATLTDPNGGNFNLTAYRNITVDGAPIQSTSGPLNVMLDSDSASSKAGGAIVVVGDTQQTGIAINSNGGNIVLGGGANPLTGYATGSDVLGYTNGILLNGAGILAGDGNITMRGKGLSGMVPSGAAITDGYVSSGIYIKDNQVSNNIAWANAMYTQGKGAITLTGIGGDNVSTIAIDNDGYIASVGIIAPQQLAVITDGGRISVLGKGENAYFSDGAIFGEARFLTKTGSTNIEGIGQNTAFSGVGLAMDNSAISNSFSSGAINLIGRGLTGVNLFNSYIYSNTGNISITGSSGATSASLTGDNYGVLMQGGGIESIGTGTRAAKVSITGSCANPSVCEDVALGLPGDTTSPFISTVDGNVNITGTDGIVYINDVQNLTSTGSGTFTITAPEVIIK